MGRVLSIAHLDKHYGDLRAISDTSLSLDAGEVVTIIGPSGSGKSTLLRCINGLETFTRGYIEFEGFQIRGTAEASRKQLNAQAKSLIGLRRHIGMVFQSFNLFPHLTAVDNVSLAPQLVLKKTKSEVRSLALELLDRVGLAERAEYFPAQLSGGQQQRVAIARSLAMSPRILLLDEITSALDPELIGEVLETVKSLAKQGQTMLMVSHQLDFARLVSDRLIVMDNGQIVDSGPPEEVLQGNQSERTRKFVRQLGAGATVEGEGV
jgi:ABC-type polar amino acid transport system ATPase subunit